MCIRDRLSAQGIIEPSALYESPFSDLHGGGPEELFANKATVIDGIFDQIEKMAANLQ